MSDYQDQMYPDHDHVHRWGDDINTHGPDEDQRMPGGRLPGLNRRSLKWGVGLGFLIVAVLMIFMLFIPMMGCAVPRVGCEAKPPCTVDTKGRIANQPCEITEDTIAAKERFDRRAWEEGMRKLREQHQDMSKAMRDYKMP